MRVRDGWLWRIGTAVLAPLGLGLASIEQLRVDAAERRRLADTLLGERQKVIKLKQQLAELEVRLAAHSEQARSLYEALTLERHPPELGETQAKAWAGSAARARIRVRNRGVELSDRRREGGDAGRAGSGSLPAGLPRLKPPPGDADADADSWRPLRIAVIGQSVFSSFPDPHAIVRPIGDPLVEAPDVLVFSRAEIKAFHTDARQVPEALWRRAAQGMTKLVFDASGEGFAHRGVDSADLHGFLRAHGAEPADALYVTQDRKFRERYEAWCAGQSEPPMSTWVFDAFAYRVLSEFRLCGPAIFDHRLADFLTRPLHRNRRFLCLNNTLRPTKVLFLLRLLRDGLWDRGWISHGALAAGREDGDQTREEITKRLLAMDGFKDEVEPLLPFMDQLEAMPPRLFTSGRDKADAKRRVGSIRAADLREYGDSWFTVVTETEMGDRLHRITEKPLKPLLAFHPFLVLGNPGSLSLLRGYGFETFSGAIDERYDEETDPRRRFDMVYDEVRRLCALDEAAMARMSAQLSEVVTFNACWGLTELPRRFDDILVNDLVEQLRPRAMLSQAGPQGSA